MAINAVGTTYYPQGSAAPSGAVMPPLDAPLMDMGNAVSPWADEAARRAANNAHLAKDGLSGDIGYALLDGKGGIRNFGLLGSDGTGGVFNPAGYSSNPNYLQSAIGVSRQSLSGTGIEGLSDKVLYNAYYNDRPFANDLWIGKDGWATNVQAPGSVSVGKIREVLAKLTGQQSTVQAGMATITAPLVKPGYYDGASANTKDMAGQQQSAIQKLLSEIFMAKTLSRTTSAADEQKSDFAKLFSLALDNASV